MKKLFLLLDEWDNDRNFVGDELKLICDKYDVTVICNSAGDDLNQKVKYVIYKRPGIDMAVLSMIRMLFDKDAWKEIRRVLSEDDGKLSKLSETVRFYINADLFRCFLNDRGFLTDDTIYYSYWYFWKCYAITHEIDRLSGSRIITRTHEYDLYDYTSPSGYQPFKESMDEKLSAVVFISEHGRDYYLDKYNRKPGDKYKLYHLGTKRPKMMISYENLKNGNDRLINLVSCSSVIERKRVHLIARALAAVDDDIVISWTHFGSGDKENELRSLCSELLAGKENISYELKGYVRNEDVHDYYSKNRVDVFITTSSSEGNPVSVMEAMSYGIPVIAPDICNFRNMIIDCGILVSEECNADEIAKALSKIAYMSMPENIKIRDNARRCWEEMFNAETNNRRFVEEVLDRL